MTNAEIASILLRLAQLLSAQKENPFKVKAYRRAARTISNLSDSIEELVRTGVDLTAIPGIGAGISATLREIVERGGALGQIETLRGKAGEVANALDEYPLLDPKLVERIYKKLGIASVAELKQSLESGSIGAKMGARMEQHVRRAMTVAAEMLLHEAHRVAPGIADFLRTKCHAERVEAAGDYRRRVEVVAELSFVIQSPNFGEVVDTFQRYGGGAKLIQNDGMTATFQIPSGIYVRIIITTARLWGLSLLAATGSEDHIAALAQTGHSLLSLADGSFPTEQAVYRKLGLQMIPPELREGNDEVEHARTGRLPDLIEEKKIAGDLHAHTTSSDGVHTIEQMAAAARDKGYTYLGITDHSQSLTIARGVPEDKLWQQLRSIDDFNRQSKSGIRILKSAEVDILADGSLDYSDAILKELDYTICSIHSRFNLGKVEQTERILRAMDNRYCNILGHATGRMLLRRPGYDLDFDRIVEHAKENGCFFEINSNPNRLDISARNARSVRQAGIKIAINTDAHSTRELDFMTRGIEQARRAGLDKEAVLNCLPWPQLQRLLRRV